MWLSNYRCACFSRLCMSIFVLCKCFVCVHVSLARHRNAGQDVGRKFQTESIWKTTAWGGCNCNIEKQKTLNYVPQAHFTHLLAACSVPYLLQHCAFAWKKTSHCFAWRVCKYSMWWWLTCEASVELWVEHLGSYEDGIPKQISVIGIVLQNVFKYFFKTSVQSSGSHGSAEANPSGRRAKNMFDDQSDRFIQFCRTELKPLTN